MKVLRPFGRQEIIARLIDTSDLLSHPGRSVNLSVMIGDELRVECSVHGPGLDLNQS